MSGMNEFLAQYYGTNQSAEQEKTASAEEQQIELFAKLAAENGIDLEKLSDEQVEQLYNDTFKTASDDEGEKKEEKKDEPSDDKEEKKAQIEADLAEKKASQEKVAEADFLGRVMAHAYVNEMRKIAAAAEPAATEPTTETTEEPKVASAKERLQNLFGKAKGHAEAAGSKAKEMAGKAKDVAGKGVDKAKEMGGKAKEHVKEHKGAYGAGAAGAGGAAAGFAAGRMTGKKKESSAALDELAVERAAEMIDEYNKTASENGQPVFDVDVAAERLAAVNTLGLNESEKVASAANADQAVEVRALEFLEAAGYPVQWAE